MWRVRFPSSDRAVVVNGPFRSAWHLAIIGISSPPCCVTSSMTYIHKGDLRTVVGSSMTHHLSERISGGIINATSWVLPGVATWPAQSNANITPAAYRDH